MSTIATIRSAADLVVAGERVGLRPFGGTDELAGTKMAVGREGVLLLGPEIVRDPDDDHRGAGAADGQVGLARAALAGWLGGCPRAGEAILVA